jgi:hypothetical protein
MNQATNKPHGAAGGGLACGGPTASAFGCSVLDTYKQFAQPNRHAGSGTFQGVEMTPFIKGIRRAIYWPLDHLSEFPGGPVHWLWLARLIVRIDAPLRGYLLRGFHAKSTR